MSDKDNTTKPELLPCPFCGGAVSMIVRDDGSGHGESYDLVTIQCDPCGASVSRGSYKDYMVEQRKVCAIKTWNRRA